MKKVYELSTKPFAIKTLYIIDKPTGHKNNSPKAGKGQVSHLEFTCYSTSYRTEPVQAAQ